MKILYLADARSPHSQKWATYFVNRGCKVHIVSFRYEKIPDITIHNLGINSISHKEGIAKWLYVSKVRRAKKLIQEIRPDILHAHYGTSYGLLGALSGFHPYLISVWGSDVFDFPKKSFFHRKLLQFNLKKADYICSTSHIMATETQKYTHKEIVVTPFGVDCGKFKPMPLLKPKDKIIIGTVKALEKKYGIEYLIKAFALIVKRHPNLPLELHIGGEGSSKGHLQKLCGDLHIENKVKFLGYIPHNEAPRIFNTFSVSVSVSESESFGVAVIEAKACGVPVVVSNIGGLPEVVKNNMTGFIVPPRNPETTAKAIEKLILDENLRSKIGKAGRQFVLRNYEWNECAKIMENLYRDVLKQNLLK